MTTPRFLRCAEKQLDLQHPQVMGVLNITPDSFSDGGNLYDDAQIPLDKILVNAQRMIDEGARYWILVENLVGPVHKLLLLQKKFVGYFLW